MNEKLYVDQRIAPDALPFQKANTGRKPVNATASPETGPLTADAAAFQPAPARILGDMVSDYQPSEPSSPGGEDTYPGVLGGRSILVAGADSAPAPGEVAPAIRGVPARRQARRTNRTENR